MYEDQNVLVINKPAGIIMHAKNRADLSPSVRSIFASKISGGEIGREGIVHRLDRDTSGVVILAKNQLSLEFLQSQFGARKVTKEYLALVWGHLKHQRARLELPIRRSLKSPAVMSVHPSGKEAISEYYVVKEYGDFSLLSVRLHTGRTHQIRVHLAHIGHPVVGDKVYSKKILPQNLNRQFLHAKRLCLQLPDKKKPNCFTTSLPDELDKFLEQIDAE